MKKLEAYGIASKNYTKAIDALNDTYTKADGSFPSTPLIFPDNPFNDAIKNAKNILDLGCGVGRNLPWIKENTKANYIGIDPNPSMLKHFWEVNDISKYGENVWLDASLNADLPAEYQPFDVVVVTFVFQHIGFRTSATQMDVSDITQEVRKYTRPDTVWIMYEHEQEEQWLLRWQMENDIVFDVYKPFYAGIPELTDRGLHDLIIWRG